MVLIIQKNNDDIITKLNTDPDSNTKLINIFKSDLCRDWLIKNGENEIIVIKTYVLLELLKIKDGKIKVNRDDVPIGHPISNELADICHCYWSEAIL